MKMASFQNLTPSVTPSICSDCSTGIEPEKEQTKSPPRPSGEALNLASSTGIAIIQVDDDAQRKGDKLQTSNEDDVTKETGDDGREVGGQEEEEDQTKTSKFIDRNLGDPPGDFEGSRSSLFRESVGAGGIFLTTTLGQRRAKAKQRLMQAKAYAELVEDRILELERKVRDLRKESHPSAAEESASTDVQAIAQVSVLGWAAFNRRIETNSKENGGEWTHRRDIDDEAKPLIEILKEAPRDKFFDSFYNQASTAAASRLTDQDALVSQAHDPSIEPHQIRIRSKLLLKVLKEITGCDTTVGPYEHRLLLLRPFKLLACFEKEIRNVLQDLEELHCGKEKGANQQQGGLAGPPTTQQITLENMFPVNETQSLEALKQLQVLCKMMDDYLNRPIKLQQGLSPSVTKVSFNDLWYLFKPGYEVRTPGESRIQLYRIIKVTGGRDVFFKGNPPERHASIKLKDEGYSDGSFVIECFYIHFDGSRFGPVNATFQIRKFDSDRDITQLPVVPIQCYTNEAELRQKLEIRGKKFTELSNPRAGAHRKYSGLTLDKTQEQVESEVIIDFGLAFIQTKVTKPTLGLQDRLVSDDSRELEEFWTMNVICGRAGCCGNDIIHNDYEIDERERNGFREKHKSLFDSSPEQPEQLKPEHMILLPPYVYGFVLRTRRWATFDIDLLDDIPPNEDGWKNLVIKKYTKDTVLALVKNHERPRDSRETIDSALSSVDLIQGKGRGLIILLHGEPGVGKTSTAECVAALTRRPLFPITCGDIGDRADAVEANLEKNFQLAHKWGCVLLLDEADIFLSARTEEDIQRNAIVSVFLRTLEYYSGILFLTTNRVGKIDRAFKSRIHLSLLYKKLNRKSTIRIWKNNIKRVRKEFANEGKKIICKRRNIIAFARQHYNELKDSEDLVVWNGRQIRNAFQTAIAIAAYDANQKNNGHDEVIPVLDASQFEMVAKSAKQFDKYLKVVSIHNDAEIAKLNTERDDEYTSSEDECREEKEERKPRKRGDKGTSRKRKRQKLGDSDSDSEEDSEENSEKDSEDDTEENSECEKDCRLTKKNKIR